MPDIKPLPDFSLLAEVYGIDINILNQAIETALTLSGRAHNGLRAKDLIYIGELVQKSSDDLTGRGFGKKSLEEVEAALAGTNLRLGMSTTEARRAAQYHETFDNICVQWKLSAVQVAQLSRKYYLPQAHENIDYMFDVSILLCAKHRVFKLDEVINTKPEDGGPSLLDRILSGQLKDVRDELKLELFGSQEKEDDLPRRQSLSSAQKPTASKP